MSVQKKRGGATRLVLCNVRVKPATSIDNYKKLWHACRFISLIAELGRKGETKTVGEGLWRDLRFKPQKIQIAKRAANLGAVLALLTTWE